jgi:hypothetical protein
MNNNTMLVMLILTAGCATSPTPQVREARISHDGLELAAGGATAPVPQVTYFAGVVTYTSPDGRIPYNKTEALLRREITGEVVVDTRAEPGPSPSMPPRTTMTRHQLDATTSDGLVRIVRQTQGPRPMKIVEEYRPVSQAEYEQVLNTMRPPKGSE